MTDKQKILILFSLGLALNLLAWALIYFQVPEENFPFIVKYNIFLGKDLFGDKTALFSLPSLGLIILAINAILALALLSKEKTFAFLIGLINLFWQVFVLFYAFAAIFINTY
ncbi:MAG: hypothetical protein AB1721_00600 [Patescibacteria group bacterium]